MAIKHISSPDNPLFRLIRRLNASPTAYRQEGKIWLEGEHLCQSCLESAAQVRDATILFIVCDRGDRYLSTGVFPA